VRRGTELGELVGGVAAAEEIEYAFKGGTRKGAEGSGATDKVVEGVYAYFGFGVGGRSVFDPRSQIETGGTRSVFILTRRKKRDGRGTCFFARRDFRRSFWGGRALWRGRVGDDGDQLLGEDVEGVAGKTRGLDVAVVHGLRYGGAGDQIGAVLGERMPSLTALTWWPARPMRCMPLATEGGASI